MNLLKSHTEENKVGRKEFFFFSKYTKFCFVSRASPCLPNIVSRKEAHLQLFININLCC